MVVFDNGKPDKSKYRRFELKNSQKNDDYSAFKEIFQRRLKRFEDEEVMLNKGLLKKSSLACFFIAALALSLIHI